MYDRPNSLVSERIHKTNVLRSLGIDPYPVVAFNPSHSISEIRREADAMADASAHVKVAGRIISRREMGRVVFLDVLDDGMRLQAFFRRSTVGDLAWKILELLDLGDFIGVEGSIFFTRTHELSIEVEGLVVLGKASHPIPLTKKADGQEFDAVTDKGTLYRHRHIDLVNNSLSRKRFLDRAQIIRETRKYLDEEGFLEVETPILGISYGGAAARPFVTIVNALNQEMFLRISPECALKRLLCGGFNKVYELGRNFRNEGIDASHNPEFTMVEWYEAYSDYFHQMTRVETLVLYYRILRGGILDSEEDGSWSRKWPLGKRSYRVYTHESAHGLVAWNPVVGPWGVCAA